MGPWSCGTLELWDPRVVGLLKFLFVCACVFVCACRVAEARKCAGNDAYQSGCYEEAVDLYSQAVYHNPNSAVYHSNRSAALMMLHRYQEALDDCTQAIKLDDAYMKVGGVQYSTGSLVLAHTSQYHTQVIFMSQLCHLCFKKSQRQNFSILASNRHTVALIFL